MSESDDVPEPAGRREFLSWVTAATAAGVVAADGGEAEPASLPTIALGRHRISRLVAGSNPLAGFSYLGGEMDREMKAYFTPERTVGFLKRCEQVGITAHQVSGASMNVAVVRALREGGSKLQFIGLHSERKGMEKMAEAIEPIGVAHHGGVTDKLFRAGQSGQVRDFVKAVHDRGLLAGVSAHNPECIQRIASEGWKVDFFMTCFYYLTRPARPADAGERPPALEGPDVGYSFLKTDPAAMCRVVRQVAQPCLGFKILGGGRLCGSQDEVRGAFRFAFEHIKPTDGVIVGMYPRHFDQPLANAGYTRELGAPA